MNIISNRALYLALIGNLDAENDTIKVALMTSAYSPELANSVVTQEDSLDLAKWDADDVVWDPSSITARYAVLYNTTRSNNIIGVYDFGSDMTSSNGPFAVRWNAAGVLAFAQA